MRMRESTHRPPYIVIAAAALLALLFATASSQPVEAADECPFVSPAEVFEAFDGEITVEVQSAASDGCIFTIEERSFSQVQITNFETYRGSGVVKKRKEEIASGELEGESVDDLGAEAVLANDTLWIRLDDGSVVGVSISIHFEQLRPMLEEDVKKSGLLTVGRLVVQRIEG